MHLAGLKIANGAQSVTGLAEVNVSHSSSKIPGNYCFNRILLSYQLKKNCIEKGSVV